MFLSSILNTLSFSCCRPILVLFRFRACTAIISNNSLFIIILCNFSFFEFESEQARFYQWPHNRSTHTHTLYYAPPGLNDSEDSDPLLHILCGDLILPTFSLNKETLSTLSPGSSWPSSSTLHQTVQTQSGITGLMMIDRD